MCGGMLPAGARAGRRRRARGRGNLNTSSEITGSISPELQQIWHTEFVAEAAAGSGGWRATQPEVVILQGGVVALALLCLETYISDRAPTPTRSRSASFLIAIEAAVEKRSHRCRA